MTAPRGHGGAAAGCLRLAAAPTFALMAALAAMPGPPAAICAAGGTSSLGGMAAMYLLMAAFHLPPWLALAAGWRAGTSS